jgi:hypothetical protein
MCRLRKPRRGRVEVGYRRISPISSRLGKGRLTETDSGRSTGKRELAFMLRYSH